MRGALLGLFSDRPPTEQHAQAGQHERALQSQRHRRVRAQQRVQADVEQLEISVGNLNPKFWFERKKKF